MRIIDRGADVLWEDSESRRQAARTSHAGIVVAVGSSAMDSADALGSWENVFDRVESKIRMLRNDWIL